jgi:hypothetical protein
LDVYFSVTDAGLGREYVIEIASSMGCTFGDIGATENFFLNEDISSQLQQAQPLGDFEIGRAHV